LTITPEAPSRRRRSPEEAEREILDAAERIVRDRPPDELTVKSVMEETTLTRNAFYAYFRDRYDLIARLVQRLRAEADAGMEAFVDSDSDRVAAGREALATAAHLYADHGELLRALADAATSDRHAARAWQEFIEPSHTAVTARVREDVRRGLISGIDPEPTVRALVAMNRACFFQELVVNPDADVERLVDTLHLIWVRTLYGLDPAAGTGGRSPRRKA
jgi:TetR/AcrR family transcriptional regulator, ethionamide resistance regulator